MARHPLHRFGEVETEASLETPCIDICEIDGGTGLCLGCGRSLDEIARWAEMSPSERRAVMTTLPARTKPGERAKG
ncbi:MAG: DUF1289 domain-containing protein [Methyloceanibacter sp.]|jgi:predicted Fe-S protein YdhL (DUF1289 family)